MSKFSNLNEECWFREYSVDFILCCLILSCLNGYAIAQPMWRIGIAPNGMAQVAIGSFFTIINCSQSSCMVLIQEICQKWILESCSSSLMCRSKILGRQIKWAFIILLFINYYFKRTSICLPSPISWRGHDMQDSSEIDHLVVTWKLRVGLKPQFPNSNSILMEAIFWRRTKIKWAFTIFFFSIHFQPLLTWNLPLLSASPVSLEDE